MIFNVQILRAVAALLVVCVHLETLIAPLGIGTAWLGCGNVGVDLFFVISGFIITHTNLHRRTGAGAFALNRVIRIVPLYWVLTLLVFGVALIAPALLGRTHADGSELVRSLLFVPFVKGDGLIQPVLFLGWTLNYEMFFYALFVVMLLATRGSATRAAAGVALVLLVCVALRGILAPMGAPGRFYSDPILIEFILGMAAAGLTARYAPWPPVLAAALIAVAVPCMLFYPLVLGDVPRWLFGGVPAMAILMSAVSLERTGQMALGRFWLLLGGASYALYLVHPFVLQAWGKAARGLLSPVTAVPLAFAGVMLAMVVGIVLHVYGEVPVTAWLRRRTGHRPSRVDREEARRAHTV